MPDRLSDVIDNNLIDVYKGPDKTEGARIWLTEKPHTQDRDSDVRMWVACNPMTPKPVLGRLAEDPVDVVLRGVAQNSSTPVPLLVRLNGDADVVVRVLASKNAASRHLFSR
jgi:hypothetical protein